MNDNNINFEKFKPKKKDWKTIKKKKQGGKLRKQRRKIREIKNDTI